ncbi:S1C family serine protease [uncultured Anaerovibrio sp.]|uniref:S1C family serine protease n=1 Tax=uncultured Anaerovibrio sp. TaxID=361586 RepID=UPI0025F707EA|nr:trypsin-like peptidase domain-containing protein [uncultured Anaerovibrio sp.]
MIKKKGFVQSCMPVVMSLLVAGSIMLGGCGNSKAAEGIPAPAPNTSISSARNTPVVQAAKAVGPAVVGITNKAIARDFFNMPRDVEGYGSGVIFRKDGYIVTNNHVIEGAKEIIVSLSDGRSLTGKLIGADEITDLAVVKVDADDLPAAEFGDSDDVMVGEPAIAIGNPMGLEFQGSVTTGVISAVNRILNKGESNMKLIQTDAAINPGNSGGALVNADGKVIGINSQKIVTNAVEGMGFAIPINTVRSVVEDLMTHGQVIRPYLGVGVFDKESAARQGYILNIKSGVYVERVTLDGPAGRAGIRRGDIILAVGGTEVNTVGELRAAIIAHKVGETVDVKYSSNGSTYTVSVKLDAMPKED